MPLRGTTKLLRACGAEGGGVVEEGVPAAAPEAAGLPPGLVVRPEVLDRIRLDAAARHRG